MRSRCLLPLVVLTLTGVVRAEAVPFDRGAAAKNMADAAAKVGSCAQPAGPKGAGHVKVTFAPNGRATKAEADTPPFQNTSTGTCVENIFMQVRIPEFTGAPVTVGKSFTL